MGPKSSDGDPDKKRRGCTKTQRQGPKKTEAEIVVMLLQAKGCPGLPPTARQGTDSPSEPPGGTSPAHTLLLNFWPPAP